jgi:hypothetical protein
MCNAARGRGWCLENEEMINRLLMNTMRSHDVHSTLFVLQSDDVGRRRLDSHKIIRLIILIDMAFRRRLAPQVVYGDFEKTVECFCGILWNAGKRLKFATHRAL